MSATKRVIDGDNLKELDSFAPEDTEKILKKYREDGRWDDVGLDHDGDIVVFEEL